MTANDVFSAEIPKINDTLKQFFSVDYGKYSAVAEAAQYSLLNGGKRVRPVILTEFYKLCGGKGDSNLNFAAALEMIHTYSLIHDDLPCMDNDNMRRGKPSCHVKFGEDTALLAGDALLTAAFSIALKPSELPEERIIRAIRELSDAAGISGMIGGQAMDLAFERHAPTAEELIEMYFKKTGALLVAAAKIGAILAGADAVKVNNAAEYAKNLGLAFQIIDDILDCTADEQLFGKPIGSDEKNGKATYVTIYGLEKAREKAEELTESALTMLDKFDGDKSAIIAVTEYLLERKY